MSFIPKPHEIYKHFKGNLYQITAIAEHTETGEELVIYQALYGDFRTYARPLGMFTERVDPKKYPDAVQEFRFELQGPDAERQKEETGGAVPWESGRGVPADAQSEMTAAMQKGMSDGGPADTKGNVSGEDTIVLQEREPEDPAGELPEEEEPDLDPLVLEFLDSDSYEQKLNILAGLHHRITDDMITTMAIASDIEINDGDIEERYEALKACLLTLERYECNRLR